MNNYEYKKYANQKANTSPLLKNIIWAFVVGGLICVLGQILLEWFMFMGLSQKQSLTLVSITLVFLSALFTAVGKYDNLAKHAGAGTLVPITGFANSVVSPAIEFKNEGFVMGVGANMFKIAGPVITYGVTASVIGGLIYYFCM